MAVWQFTKEGDISNGEYIISFQQLVETIERSNSNSINIDSTNMGEMLSHNDLVYINQSNGKFYKSLNTGVANQAQNVIGVYRYKYNKHQNYHHYEQNSPKHRQQNLNASFLYTFFSNLACQ